MTTAAIERPTSPLPAAGTAGDGRGVLGACVVLVVLGQRLALPLGGDNQVPVTIVGLLLLTFYGLARGGLVPEPRRCLLFGIALSTLAVLTFVSVARDQNPSLLSLVLVMLIYLPAVTVARSRPAAAAAIRLFVDLMVGLALLGVVLFVLQYAGLPYRDYVAEVVPQAFVQQDYVTSYPLTYGSTIFRSNGVFFLEASFFSLFLGLAAVVSLTMRHRTRWLPIVLAALVCTASGNGIVLLLASLVTVLFGPYRRRLVVLVVPLVAAGVLLLVTPLGPLLAERATEINTDNSSASLRVVQPYEVLGPPYLSSPATALTGSGAGSAQTYLEDTVGELAVIPLAVPKLLFEYGMLGALAMLVFLLWVFLRDGLRAPWMPGLLLAYFLVNASLQQATLAAVTYLFLSILPGAQEDSVGERA